MVEQSTTRCLQVWKLKDIIRDLSESFPWILESSFQQFFSSPKAFNEWDPQDCMWNISMYCTYLPGLKPFQVCYVKTMGLICGLEFYIIWIILDVSHHPTLQSPESLAKQSHSCYPLVVNVAIENGHVWWVFRLNMVVFHSAICDRMEHPNMSCCWLVPSGKRSMQLWKLMNRKNSRHIYGNVQSLYYQRVSTDLPFENDILRGSEGYHSSVFSRCRPATTNTMCNVSSFSCNQLLM